RKSRGGMSSTNSWSPTSSARTAWRAASEESSLGSDQQWRASSHELLFGLSQRGRIERCKPAEFARDQRANGFAVAIKDTIACQRRDFRSRKQRADQIQRIGAADGDEFAVCRCSP